MIHLNDFRVHRQSRCICNVPSLDVAAGERVAICGANGTGKTTLLRTIAGLQEGYEGVCCIEVAKTDRVYVHQAPYLFRGTCHGNVTYGLRARQIHRSQRKPIVDDWLRRFQLQSLQHAQVARLSGGESRRVALARAFVLRPALLLLDEPLADLDSDGIECLRRAMDACPETTFLVSSPLPLNNGLVQRSIQLTNAPA